MHKSRRTDYNLRSSSRKLGSDFTKYVVKAIAHLREPWGSSSRAIKDFITANYGLREARVQEQLRTALRTGAAFGLIEAVRPGRYKLDSGFVVSAKRGKRRKSGSKRRKGGRRRRRRMTPEESL